MGPRGKPRGGGRGGGRGGRGGRGGKGAKPSSSSTPDIEELDVLDPGKFLTETPTVNDPPVIRETSSKFVDRSQEEGKLFHLYVALLSEI